MGEGRAMNQGYQGHQKLSFFHADTLKCYGGMRNSNHLQERTSKVGARLEPRDWRLEKARKPPVGLEE